MLLVSPEPPDYVFGVDGASHELRQLRDGTWTIHSRLEDECFHPGLGPAAEAKALYVEQLKVRERMEQQEGCFVVWDVGLGSGANALTFLRETGDLPVEVEMLSFDHTLEPLRLALRSPDRLPYVAGFEEALRQLLEKGEWREGNRHWKLVEGDFPGLMKNEAAEKLPRPDVIFHDAYSPGKNPEMWTLPLFEGIRRQVGDKACMLATYSRSTMLRVSLLLAGFHVGVGRPTGVQEETTIAATRKDLLEEPLESGWLDRVRISGNAEPMMKGPYVQRPILEESLERLLGHPQFA